MYAQKRASSQGGMALIAVLLILILLSALAIAVLYKVSIEQRVQKTDSGNTRAFYAAEAAMEKINADLNALYATQAAPNWCAITALQASPPNTTDVDATYPEYLITVPNPPAGCTPPPSRVQTISSGPNAGLLALIVPLTLQVTADTKPGEEVRMIRQVEVAEIPVFQFGIYSQSDLDFFPGPAFDFNGRVQTNGSLYLAADTGITFHTKIRAAGDVVRDKLANGGDTLAQGRTGYINIPTAPAGCDGSAPACRNLRLSPNEGSSTGGPTPAYGGTGTANAGWASLSTSTYNGNILSGSTGARALNLAFVQTGVDPIEIVRRPLPAELIDSAVSQSRLYTLAQIRVLISDDPGELTGGSGDSQNIRLANVQTNGSAPDYTNGVPVTGSVAGRTYFAEGTSAAVSTESGWIVPTAEPTLLPSGAPVYATGTPTKWNLLDGYLRVEIRLADGTYQAVTKEWLELGFARGLNPPKLGALNTIHPNAILILQQQADRDADGVLDPAVAACPTCHPATLAIPAELVTDGGTNTVVTGTATRTNWYPINFYDTREGEQRENRRASTTCNVGGVVNAVELDVTNLRRWLVGTIGTSGTLTESVTQNGYVLYFSDRRGMKPNPNAANVKNGEYGFEDVTNPASTSGAPDNTLQAGEDVNGNGLLDTWGKANLGLGLGTGNSGNPNQAVNCLGAARKNRVSGARHVLRVENGSLGNVPVKPDGTGGFTVASENPAYILGDYNANTASGFGSPHASSAILADTVTLLSNGWSDRTAWNNPTDALNGRSGATTYYRVAIAMGKGKFFTPGFSGAPADFGTDGGVHNFLRYMEDWGGATSNYLGSMVSLYYSMYATGTYKCCDMVYDPPTRAYAFDTDFLDLSKMPPGTPRFRDIANLGFQQVF